MERQRVAHSRGFHRELLTQPWPMEPHETHGKDDLYHAGAHRLRVYGSELRNGAILFHGELVPQWDARLDLLQLAMEVKDYRVLDGFETKGGIVL